MILYTSSEVYAINMTNTVKTKSFDFTDQIVAYDEWVFQLMPTLKTLLRSEPGSIHAENESDSRSVKKSYI